MTIMCVYPMQWCPPCMRLLPEFRKASKHMSASVKFGTVDCTVHVGLCQQVGFYCFFAASLYYILFCICSQYN